MVLRLESRYERHKDATRVFLFVPDEVFSVRDLSFAPMGGFFRAGPFRYFEDMWKTVSI